MNKWSFWCHHIRIYIATSVSNFKYGTSWFYYLPNLHGFVSMPILLARTYNAETLTLNCLCNYIPPSWTLQNLYETKSNISQMFFMHNQDYKVHDIFDLMKYSMDLHSQLLMIFKVWPSEFAHNSRSLEWVTSQRQSQFTLERAKRGRSRTLWTSLVLLWMFPGHNRSPTQKRKFARL